jgi:hypothetical protein
VAGDDATHTRFVPGLELSRALYEEAVRPILAETFAGLVQTAARIGSGSEVLGYDSLRSSDHEWGPRLDVFLDAEDRATRGVELRRVLAERLPKQIRGWPTHFRESDDPLDPVGRMEPTDGAVNHRVLVHDVATWLTSHVGIDVASREPSTLEWLAIPNRTSPR